MAEFLDKDGGPADEPGDPEKDGEPKRSPVLRFLHKGLAGMTVREQQAVLVVLLLGLLGIGVKLWHLKRGPGEGAVHAAEAAERRGGGDEI